MKATIVFALIAAVSAVRFGNTSPPTCHVDAAGRTVVFYSSTHPEHKSFLCTHSKKACTCARHPSHHHGKCRQFDHTTGKRLDINGDCGASGRNPAYSSWGGWSRCTAGCGGGTQARSRTCNHSTSVCTSAGKGAATQSRTCNTHRCCRNVTREVLSCGARCTLIKWNWGTPMCACRVQGSYADVIRSPSRSYVTKCV